MSDLKPRRTKELPSLTRRQLDALKAIILYREKYDTYPTQRELSRILGHRSDQGAKSLLDALERKGYIRRERNRWRSLTVVATP